MIALLAAVVTHAYVPVGSSIDNSTAILVDVQSISKIAGYTEFWEVVVNRRGKPGTLAYTLAKDRIDCSGHTYSWVSSVYYSANGRVLGDSRYPSPESSIAPESMEEAVQAMVCQPVGNLLMKAILDSSPGDLKTAVSMGHALIGQPDPAPKLPSPDQVYRANGWKH